MGHLLVWVVEMGDLLGWVVEMGELQGCTFGADEGFVGLNFSWVVQIGICLPGWCI